MAEGLSPPPQQEWWRVTSAEIGSRQPQGCRKAACVRNPVGAGSKNRAGSGGCMQGHGQKYSRPCQGRQPRPVPPAVPGPALSTSRNSSRVLSSQGEEVSAQSLGRLLCVVRLPTDQLHRGANEASDVVAEEGRASKRISRRSTCHTYWPAVPISKAC